MRELPSGPALLAIAREVLLAELLPHLPEDKVLAARMVANAMGIAAREAAQDAGWIAEARARMSALTGDAADPLRAFAAAIRAGAFDPGAPRHAEAAALLRDITRARCAVSAPRALDGG
jgi:hypothetical protein